MPPTTRWSWNDTNATCRDRCDRDHRADRVVCYSAPTRLALALLAHSGLHVRGLSILLDARTVSGARLDSSLPGNAPGAHRAGRMLGGVPLRDLKRVKECSR